MNLSIYTDHLNNAIRFSSFAKMETETMFSGMGIKYVASGEEIYYVNGNKYAVKQGEYIIGNDFTSAFVKIDHHQAVQGLCIDVSTQIIDEVAGYHHLHGDDLKSFLLSEQFLVNKYQAKNTTLGYSLYEINKSIQNKSFDSLMLNEEVFYSLAESIIEDQRYIFNHLNKLNFTKENTNTEVFRLLLQAKNYIHDKLHQHVSLDELTVEIGMSKYHFIRLFKKVFGLSPYQYQKVKRVEYAKTLLQKGVNVAEVAIQLGYTDTASFSKSFKQVSGINPSDIKKQFSTIKI